MLAATIKLRVDHELIGRVFAERERRRLLPSAHDFRVTESHAMLLRRVVAAGEIS